MSNEDVQRSYIAESTRARATGIAAVAERIEVVEGWLAEGMSPRRAARQAQQPPPAGLGLQRVTANRYVAAALLRLQRDSTAEPLESKRARIVAMIHENIRAAKANVRTWVTEGGEVSQPAPDYKAINGALALLAEIEGVKGG